MSSHLVKQVSKKNADWINSNRRENKHERNLYLDKKPICPCCSYPLLRHISLHEVYWYCSHCHQKMPLAHNAAQLIKGSDTRVFMQLTMKLKSLRQREDKEILFLSSLAFLLSFLALLFLTFF